MAKQLLAKGMGASPGTATGVIVFRSEDAVELASQGKAVILVRIETTPDDVPGMKIAAGIVTTRGGITGERARRRTEIDRGGEIRQRWQRRER